MDDLLGGEQARRLLVRSLDRELRCHNALLDLDLRYVDVRSGRRASGKVDVARAVFLGLGRGGRERQPRPAWPDGDRRGLSPVVLAPDWLDPHLHPLRRVEVNGLGVRLALLEEYLVLDDADLAGARPLRDADRLADAADRAPGNADGLDGPPAAAAPEGRAVVGAVSGERVGAAGDDALP